MREYSWPSENGYDAPDAALAWPETVRALPIGAPITGEVIGRQPFGVFLLLDHHPDAVGLARVDRMPRCMALPTVGQRVAGEVVWLAGHHHQVGITLDEWARHIDLLPQFADRVGEIATGRVTKIAPIGFFVRLADCVEGLVPISQSAGAVREGQEIRVRITNVDPERSRMVLSADIAS